MPATIPDYTYIPIYGIEEYDALGVASSALLGGGAKDVNNDNLMVTLWTQIVESQAGIPIDGQLVKPAYAFGGDWFSQSLGPQPAGHNIYDLPNVGWKSNLRSRYSARFLLDVQSKTSITYPFIAFLRPPQELRQMLVGALSLDDDGNVVYQRPMIDIFTWNQYAVQMDDAGEGNGPDSVTANFSGFYSDVPYYLGNGADGVFPTPFAAVPEVLASGSANVPALIEALRTGDFSVAAWLFPNTGATSLMHTLEWPHSIGRG